MSAKPVEDGEGPASVDRTSASLSSSGVPAIEVARAAADAASFKGAEDICIIDLTELSDVCDYFVIATGSNTRMVDAIVDEVEEQVAKLAASIRSPSRGARSAIGSSWTTAR